MTTSSSISTKASRRFWSRWLSALLASSVIWGVLAYFSGSAGILEEVSLGGWMGQRLKGSSDVLGVFRLAGMVALVIAVAAPRHSGKLLKRALPVIGRIARVTGRLMEGTWSRKDGATGPIRFRLTRCGRFLQGSWGHTDDRRAADGGLPFSWRATRRIWD